MVREPGKVNPAGMFQIINWDFKEPALGKGPGPLIS
jgi:hypothetical protein